MKNQLIEGYTEFNAAIRKDWIAEGVNYIKIVELVDTGKVTVFELIPNSEIPESDDLIHNIHSEDIDDLLEPAARVKFLVHEIYLDEPE